MAAWLEFDLRDILSMGLREPTTLSPSDGTTWGSPTWATRTELDQPRTGPTTAAARTFRTLGRTAQPMMKIEIEAIVEDECD